MAMSAGNKSIPWRIIGWGAAALLLMVPLAAGFPWGPTDFVVAGILFGLAGLGLELAVRVSANRTYRIAAAIAVAAAFLLVWVNLAVGFLGDEDNPANLMFLGVLAVAFIASVVARFEPAGMARVMAATALAQALAGAIGLAAGWSSPGADGIYEVVMGTALFGGLWLASSLLFHRAAQ